MNPLQRFVAELLEREGGAVEPVEPEGLEVLTPPALQKTLDLPEMARLGFGPELPVGARRVSLESDWMEALEAVLDGHGRYLQQVLDPPNPPPDDPQRVLQRTLELDNATWRLKGVEPAWTRYQILTFAYTALSDEKRDGLLQVGLNLANGATLDGLLERLLEERDQAPRIDAPPPAVQLPPPWQGRQLETVLGRTLPLRVRGQLEPFLRSLGRRQGRDLERLHHYHDDLRREALTRLAALPREGLSDRQQAERERETARLEAIGREYQAKVADLRQKYAMTVSIQWVQTLELAMPVQRFQVLLKRRKGERLFPLDWNPLAHRLEPAPCEYSHTPERPRMVCDQALHLISPAAGAPCQACGKPFCRACHSVQCPRCGQRLESR